MQNLWNMYVKVIPTRMGAIETLARIFKERLEKTRIENKIAVVLKSDIIYSTRILREVLRTMPQE